MADDSGLYAKIAEDVSESLEADSQGPTTEPSTLLQKLKGAISKSIQSKVDAILQDVQKFSDHAKLYLYLQLPSGPSSGEKNLDLASLGSVEHMHACTWIRNHLEEYPDTCLPKQDVYDAYKRYCDNLCSHSLSAANFGKIIREIFPNIKARRLGGRGQSKYCYSGIRRKTVVNMPPLPSLDLKETETPERSEMVHSYNDEVMDAACALTCDWAEKILKRSFNNIVEVAQFLIQQHIISSRSAHADLVMAVVVSENAEPSREKRPPPSVKKNEPETPDSAAKTQPQAKTENTPKPVAAPPRSEPKKATECPPKAASSPQVNALMARLPLLLPRVQVQPGDRLVVAPGVTAVHAPPPVLASKLAPPPVAGTVKMALSMGPPPSALLAPVVNGPTGVVGQPSAVPVINMMPVINVAVPPVAEIPLKPKSKPLGGGVNGCEAGRSPHASPEAKAPSKRPAETPGEATVKRKRGRPRKKPEAPVPEKRPRQEGAAEAKEDSDIIVVTVGYGNQPSAPSSPSWPEEETSDVEVVHVSEAKKPPPKGTSKEGPSSGSSAPPTHPPPKPAVIPTQVSVIRGRTSSPPIFAKEMAGAPEEPCRLLPGAPRSGTEARVATGRELDQAERYRSPESDLQPTDLSMRRAVPPSAKDPAARAPSMRLRRTSAEQGKEAETVSPPAAKLQAPSR